MILTNLTSVLVRKYAGVTLDGAVSSVVYFPRVIACWYHGVTLVVLVRLQCQGWCDPRQTPLSSPPPSHLLEPSLPSLILQQALCNTLPLLMLNVGGAKTRKIGSFPTHHTAARQIAFRKPVSPRIRLGPTSPECPSRFPCFFSFIFVTLIFVMKYIRLGMS